MIACTAGFVEMVVAIWKRIKRESRKGFIVPNKVYFKIPDDGEV
jgi:hypothetical protein